MPEQQQLFFSIATLIVAFAALVVAYQAQRYTQRRHVAIDRISEIKALTATLEEYEKALTGLRQALGGCLERVSKLEGTSEVSWRILEIYAGKTLHRHEDELHVDYYLDHYDSLTEEEVQAFIERLHEIADDPTVTDGTKMAAGVKLAAVIRRYGEKYHLKLPVRLHLL